MSSISKPTGPISNIDGKPHIDHLQLGAKVGIYKNGRVEIIPNDQGQRPAFPERLPRVQ